MREVGIGSYTLGMEVGRLTLCIDKVSVGSRLVDSVKLSLESKEICLTQRPGLSYGQAIQLVTNLQQPLVLVSEALINLSLSVVQSATI